MAWGGVLGLVVLFGLPLAGQCGPIHELVKFSKDMKCPEPFVMAATAEQLPMLMLANVFGLCGVLRFIGGAFSGNTGAWAGCMASMLAEIVFMVQVYGPTNPECVPVYALCGTTFLYMLINMPGHGHSHGHGHAASKEDHAHGHDAVKQLPPACQPVDHHHQPTVYLPAACMPTCLYAYLPVNVRAGLAALQDGNCITENQHGHGHDKGHSHGHGNKSD